MGIAARPHGFGHQVREDLEARRISHAGERGVQIQTLTVTGRRACDVVQTTTYSGARLSILGGLIRPIEEQAGHQLQGFEPPWGMLFGGRGESASEIACEGRMGDKASRFRVAGGEEPSHDQSAGFLLLSDRDARPLARQVA